jgi:hypothetical protein
VTFVSSSARPFGNQIRASFAAFVDFGVHLGIALHCPHFASCRLFGSPAISALVIVNPSQQSPSKRIPDWRCLGGVFLDVVHIFDRFVFPVASQRLAVIVSAVVLRSRESHSSPVLTFRVLPSTRVESVHRFHQSKSRPLSHSSAQIASSDVIRPVLEFRLSSTMSLDEGRRCHQRASFPCFGRPSRATGPI